ncbi:MAG: hypothetical protein AAGF12_32515 [Myxococcota bacterium]
MASLEDALTSPEKKEVVIDDCMQILDQEVADKKGLSGIAIKTAFKAVKGIGKGFIRGVVSDLVPEFAVALDPIYQEALAEEKPVRAHFQANSGRVADSLLAITDGKAERTSRSIIKKSYAKLRPQAKANVEAAVPRLGGLVEKHAV